MRSLVSALSGFAAHLAGSSAAAEVEEEAGVTYDGPDLLTHALSDDVRTHLAVRLLSPVEVARLACTCTTWRNFVRDAGVWRLKHARLNVGPPLPGTASPGEALAALCRALELSCVVAPATECTIAWQDEPRHWERVDALMPSALCPASVMVLKHVFWLDVTSPWVTLPAGVWLLRFRVMNGSTDQLAAPGLLVKVEAEDTAAPVRCEQAEHWPCSPLDGVAHEVGPLIADITAGDRRPVVESKVRRLMMASGPGVRPGLVLRPQHNPLHTWLYVSAGIVHVPAGLPGPVRVRARLFDHGGAMMYTAWLLDAVQAVPLHDPTHWPMPSKVIQAAAVQ